MVEFIFPLYICRENGLKILRTGLRLRNEGAVVIKVEFVQEITFAREDISAILFFVLYLICLKTYHTKSETPCFPSNAFSCFSLFINT